MSVLIKGMELPKDCPYCKMAYYNASDEFTGCAVVPDKRYAMHNDAVYAKSTQRPDWCPLVEIPEPHGDLIDRDAFRADFSMGENCDKCGVVLKRCEYDRIYTKMDFCGWLDDAPTVIKAEGGEDE